jgi:uracil-DNA glycosylase family 4
LPQMSALTELYKEIERCQDCELAKNRTRVVPGEGSEEADILFIGEAPGWHEDQQGRPFVGPAGQFLEELLASIGLKRDKVYIANVIKCRPPSNRDPLPGEIQACSKWLDRQIGLLHPKIIVTLGRYSMARYFSNQSISKVHGKAKKENNIIYYAMYHPAAALHQGSLRKIIEADMLNIPQILAQADKLTENETEPQQLSLF